MLHTSRELSAIFFFRKHVTKTIQRQVIQQVIYILDRLLMCSSVTYLVYFATAKAILTH